jgi:hypothetical protein
MSGLRIVEAEAAIVDTNLAAKKHEGDMLRLVK